MKWEVVIGLETHAQLSTVSKIFSGAATAFGAEPNTQACAVDIALPGVLPVLNKGAVERAIRFGLAVGGTINRRSVFARKNYFYPDLPKGYQISQYEIPVVQGGSIRIASPMRGEVEVRLTRAHLEEDAGKSLHEDFHGMTGIDLNRAGTPLLEIVSEPDLRSSEEAVAYAKALHSLVRWIDICDGNMQEGSFRFDANVSVRPVGEPKLGTRCEIKNLNSFRFLQQAIEFELRRQVELIEDGGRVEQETRLFDPDRGETRSMRTKEEAHDYRYFPDPDLPPLVIEEASIEKIRSQRGDTPDQREQRYMKDLALPSYDARSLTVSRDMADYFDALCDAFARKLDVALVLPESAKTCANWVTGPVAAAVNNANVDFAHCPVRPEQLADLLKEVHDGTLSLKQARDEAFPAIWAMPPGKATP
ncbi:MAG TPA: Asp-tRNA(Asn)/Glu-tRNA(Gln) amidotransferase subunit GatB, partial [Casimicrobiaceae bacterium]|nr:Asp-tRNA(Asn)/Glu-tRNA(Gln) amidotransferase subunit GatB [Casimicrobiaceae bacterium]